MYHKLSWKHAFDEHMFTISREDSVVLETILKLLFSNLALKYVYVTSLSQFKYNFKTIQQLNFISTKNLIWNPKKYYITSERQRTIITNAR